ncbi:MAG: tetratricopeptide repeat protein [Acidobacteriota bacterium]
MPQTARTTVLLTVFLSIVVSLSTTPQLTAQTTFGRLTVKIVDPQGQPLEGTTITATCDSLADFNEVKVTDKKGKVTFGFTDATYTYSFKFDKEGYNSADTRIKPEVKRTTFREFTLEQLSATPPPATSGTTTRIVYTPAEKIFNEGVKLFETGDRDGAKAKFLEALGKDTEMAMAHSALGGIYLEEQDYDAALASGKRLAEIDPTKTRGYRLQYEAFKALGQEDKAKDALKALSALDKEGDAAGLVFNEAVDAYDVGDNAAARTRFEEVLQLKPDFRPALDALLGIYIREGSHQQAAATAEKILAQDPKDLRALRIRHDAYRGLGDEEKAAAAVAALAEVDPTATAGSVFEQAVATFEGGDTATAINQFQQVLSIDPKYSRAHYRLGLCFVSLGENPKAKEHLQQFIDMAPPEDPEIATAKDMLGYLD